MGKVHAVGDHQGADNDAQTLARLESGKHTCVPAKMQRLKCPCTRLRFGSINNEIDSH